MTINFNNILLRQEPNNADVGMVVNLTTNSTTMVEQTQMKTINVDTSTLTTGQKKTVNDFIALLKSKL